MPWLDVLAGGTPLSESLHVRANLHPPLAPTRQKQETSLLLASYLNYMFVLLLVRLSPLLAGLLQALPRPLIKEAEVLAKGPAEAQPQHAP